MFDLQVTIKTITGMLTAPDETARGYREADPGWQQTLMQLPLPLAVITGLISGVLGSVAGGLFGMGGFGLAMFLLTVASALVMSFVLAWVLQQTAGFFDGDKHFDRAYALVGLVMVITSVGAILGVLPWIGWLLSLAASVYALYLAYQYVPLFLAVPEENRVKHIVVAAILALIAGMVLSGIVGLFAVGVGVASGLDEDAGADVGWAEQVEDTSGSMFGGLERQAEISEKAAEDTYSPPADGRLTEAQVEAFAQALTKTAALRRRIENRFENADSKEPSISDIFGGMGDVVRLGTAEMEVVKTAGGNWAEHQWVRNQIETARIQQDINETVRHNYALFVKYQAEIEAAE